MVTAAGGSLQVISLIFSSLRTYFTHPHPNRLIRRLRSMHHCYTQREQQQLLLLLLSLISVCFFICNRTEVLKEDDCVMVGQRVQQQRTTSLSLNKPQFNSNSPGPGAPGFIKGMGDDTLVLIIQWCGV